MNLAAFGGLNGMVFGGRPLSGVTTFGRRSSRDDQWNSHALTNIRWAIETRKSPLRLTTYRCFYLARKTCRSSSKYLNIKKKKIYSTVVHRRAVYEFKLFTLLLFTIKSNPESPRAVNCSSSCHCAPRVGVFQRGHRKKSQTRKEQKNCGGK